MKQLYTLYSILCPAVLCLAACTTIVVDEPPVDGLVSIGFSPQAETRAAVTGTELPNGSRFNVWGGYGGNNVFSGREVTKTANGCIYQGTEYWMPGQTYNFYAVYPAGLKADAVAVTDEGTVTVSGFDCSATGDAAVDLMTASATSVLADRVINSQSAVGLKFRHLLSLLTFTFENKLASHSIDVTNLRLTIAVKADYLSTSSPSWMNHASDRKEFAFYPAEAPLGVANSVSATSAPLLVIPQENAGIIVTFTVNIREAYADGGSLVFSKRYAVPLATGEQTVADRNGGSVVVEDQWYTGCRYNYKAVIPENVMDGQDITLTVSIKDWDIEDTSVSWDNDDEGNAVNNP